MIKMITKKTNNKKGFTLIELIVVIAILGILAAIAIPRLGAFRETAEDGSEVASARTIISAVQMYQAQNGDVASIDVGDLDEYLNEATALDTAGYSVTISDGEVTLVTTPSGTYTPGAEVLVKP